MEVLRKRAATLFSTRVLPAESSRDGQTPSRSPIREKAALQEKTNEEPGTPGSRMTGSDAQSTFIDNTEEPRLNFSHNPVRHLPPWVQNAREDDDDEDDLNPASGLLPREPSATQVAQHNHTPSVVHPTGFLGWHKTEPGRKYDSKRRWDPPIARHHSRSAASRWRQFAQESQYPRSESEHRQVVDEDYLATHEPDFYSDWDGEHQDTEAHAWRPKRRTAWIRIQRTVLKSPFIPLLFRLLVFTFCVTALGLGVNIYRSFRQVFSLNEQLTSTCHMDYETSTTSPLMAVVIDAAAIVYLFGMTWDEYKGKPLGLRSGKTKISVLLLDLFFIVFSSANVTLAFESVRGFGPGCQEQESLQSIKWKQDFLAAALLAALVSWLMTFAVSVLRVVEKFDH